jgi:hypothetical protein
VEIKLSKVFWVISMVWFVSVTLGAHKIQVANIFSEYGLTVLFLWLKPGSICDAQICDHWWLSKWHSKIDSPGKKTRF